MNNYKVQGHIGEGAHGYVMKALNIKTNKPVALKKLMVKHNDGISMGIVREINALQNVDCDNIVQLIDVIPQGMGFILVMEFVPLSLWELIRDPRYELTEAQSKKYMKMLLYGLSHMHEKNLMHRDLKPANLLINEDGVLKIADFGLARIYSREDVDRQYSHQVATRWYRAPELLYGSRDYTPAVDMWAAGCIFGEIINRSPLFPGETDIEQLVIVLQTLGTPTEESWPGLKALPDYNKITFPPYPGIPWAETMPDSDSKTIDFIKCFILYSAKKRPTATEALKHEYFFKKPTECPIEDMPRPLPPRDWALDSKFDFEPLTTIINYV